MCIYICICISWVASKFGYGSARGDPDVWIGLDHLRFWYGSGVWIGPVGFRVWIGAFYFDSQPSDYIYIYCSKCKEIHTSMISM